MKSGRHFGLGFVVSLLAMGTLCAPVQAQPQERRPAPPPGAPVAPGQEHRPGAPLHGPEAMPPHGPMPMAAHVDPAAAAARMQALEDQRERDRRIKIRNEAAWEASQDARAAAHRREVMEHWGAIASRADARAELQVHADRMARLNRILDVAIDSHDDTLASHCRQVIQREVARNARAMARIEAGGAP